MAKTLITSKKLFSVPRSLPGSTSVSLLQQPHGGPYRSYYSEHHPDPPPFSHAHAAILSAALNRVPDYGFSSQALSLGAKDAGFLEVSVQLFPRGVYDLINFHLVTQRLALKDRVQFPVDAKLGVGKKVRVLTLERLKANKDVIHQWQGVSPTCAPKVFFSSEPNHLTRRHSVTCPYWKTSRLLSENSMPSQTKSGILRATPAWTRPGILNACLLQRYTLARNYS